jgi:formylglycine-generating enzyme required for sulfatase activity
MQRNHPIRIDLVLCALIFCLYVGFLLPASAQDTEQTPIPTPSPVVEALEAWDVLSQPSNSDWTPQVREFDGMEMVLVPSGCFMMWSNDGFPDEEPVHEVCIEEPFWFDRTEVSQEDFARLNGDRFSANRDGTVGSCIAGDDLPENCLIWAEADLFCRMRGGNLPTEAQWEYAARGPDALIYPWGNSFDGIQLNYRDDGTEDGYATIAPVTAFENGASWVGALNLSGNVSELTQTVYDQSLYPYPYMSSDGRNSQGAVSDEGPINHVLRGGSWSSSEDNVRAAYRNFDNSFFTQETVGLRCIRGVALVEEASTGDIPTVTVTARDSNINIREDAGTEFAVIDVLAVGESAIVTGKRVGSDGFTWWRLESGGWVREDTVVESGDTSVIPDA